ncbi:MAG: ABC transporter permease [Bacteroidia bacterium]|nr:ABC transporter permease [Bacteroidia bacterium]
MFYLRLAWRNIWRNRRRTLITMASVFFAVILSSLMMSFKVGTHTNLIQSMVANYSGYAQLHHKDFWENKTLDNSLIVSDSLKTALEQNRNIDSYLPRLESFALSASRVKTKGAMVVGVDPDIEQIHNALHERVSVGEYITGDDNAVMIGEGLAEYLELNVGDSIVLMGQGYHATTSAGKYLIKALVKFGSPELSKQIVFIPLKKAQELYNTGNRYSSLILVLRDPKKLDRVVERINKQNGPYQAKTWKEIMPSLNSMVETDKVEGYVFMLILYLVISFGIFGTMLMMLTERIREFGVLVAVGMKRAMLAFMVFLEVVAMSLLGAFAGLLGAFPVCYYFNVNPIVFGDELADMFTEFGFEPVLKASFEPSIFMQQALIIGLIACFIAIYPLISLNHLKAVKAMRS